MKDNDFEKESLLFSGEGEGESEGEEGEGWLSPIEESEIG